MCHTSVVLSILTLLSAELLSPIGLRGSRRADPLTGEALMLEVPCDLYADGHLVASNLIVWIHRDNQPPHKGRFHVPANLEVLSGTRYHLELLGERAAWWHIPAGHAMDVIITEVWARSHISPWSRR